MTVKIGMLCVACGGLCRLSKHIPMYNSDHPLHSRMANGNSVYRLLSPVPFRPSGALVYPVDEDTVIESLRIGFLEQMVTSLPARLLRFEYRIDQIEGMLMRRELQMRGMVSLLLPAIQVAQVVQIETTGPLTDFALPGVYLDETQELPRS